MAYIRGNRRGVMPSPAPWSSEPDLERDPYPAQFEDQEETDFHHPFSPPSRRVEPRRQRENAVVSPHGTSLKVEFPLMTSLVGVRP